MSTFSRIQLGLRALQAQEKSIDVIGHNIANVNTRGFSRQRADLTTTPPFAAPGRFNASHGQVGSGVLVSTIKQMRDNCLDRQIRNELSLYGEWNQNKDILNRVERLVNEPSEGGLQSIMDDFFASLEKLSMQPESVAVRESVRQQGNVMTSSFNSLYQQLEDYRRDLNHSISARVDEINTIAHRVADLNKQIRKIISNNEIPNDLLDQRQMLVEDLQELVGLQVNEDSKGHWNISVGGVYLVQEDMVKEMEVYVDTTNDNLYSLRWADSQMPFEVDGGALAALFNGRDEVIGGLKNNLDQLAGKMIEKFNDLHMDGYGLDGQTGRAFFAGNGAGDIRLSNDVLADLGAIAAALKADAPGDADNILRLLNLKDTGVLEGNTATFDDYYRSIVSQLGVMGQKADRMSRNQQFMVESLRNQQDSISGVNLDEELANLVLHQHAYSAASHYIAKADEMLQTLINMVR